MSKNISLCTTSTTSQNPKPKSKIKKNDISADKSNTFKMKPPRTSSQIEGKVKDKGAKNNLTKRPPSRNCPVSKRNH